MNAYRQQQLESLTAIRDAHLAQHPEDTLFPVTVCCWMGSTYFQAWIPVKEIKIDGGMSTFDTVWVTAENMPDAQLDVCREFDMNWSFQQDETYPTMTNVVETGISGEGQNVIKPQMVRINGVMTWAYPMECGWVFKA
jgi:hypothetical protein